MKFHPPRALPLLCSTHFSRLVFVLLLALGANLGLHMEFVLSATSITQSTGTGSLGTEVLPPSGNVYGITGGTPVGNNLYHSFVQFNIGTGDIAQFQTTTPDPNAMMSNILARVTGGNPSSIFGTIDSATYYPGANFFLMNPYGIIFGPNATLNVGGSVTFTTADYLRLTDNVRFEAIPGAQDALLSAFPVAAFGFLGSNTAAIAVQGSQLTVANGTGLSLIGGNHGFTYMNPDTGDTASVPDGVTMTGGKLSAPSGQINLASVASAGEISADDFMPTSGMTMGDIGLSQGTVLDVSGNAAGTVRIRGGQFVMDQATISADTGNANGAPVAIDITVTGKVSISTVDVPALTARITGSGNAGDIQITSGSMDVTSTTVNSFLFAAIDTRISGSGNASNVNILTGDLTVTGDPFSGGTFFIDSGTSGNSNPGRGGDVTISAGSIELQDTGIATGNFSAFLNGDGGGNKAGNVNITADRLQMEHSLIVTDTSDPDNPLGTSGAISITAREVSLNFGDLSSTGFVGSGAITITADHLVATSSQIQALTTLNNGGAVTVAGNVIEFREGSNIASSTLGDGDAGSIRITATDHLGLLQSSPSIHPSGLFSNSVGDLGSLGKAGDILIATPTLQITGGARIDTTTATSGHGGNVTINTTNSTSMSGENGGFLPDPLFSLGTIQSSGIFTRTIGGNCAGSCGNAGNVSINTGSLSMGAGSQINSGTSSSGPGGTISINAGNTILISGTLSSGQPGGIQSNTIGTASDSGAGGNVAISAGQSVVILDGASVSASSTGPGDAGNISINAGQQFDMRNSSVKTEASQAGGGNIDIQAVHLIRLVDSTISTSVLGGGGSGGNITIDPNIVVLQNSNVIAQAVQGAGGNITITTPLFLSDQSSLVSASSQFGLNGPVTIQRPTSNLSGSVGTLPSNLSQAQSLLTQRCAALANGQASSFVVAGREQLPADPGSWLTSPLYATGVGLGVKAEGVKAEGGSAGAAPAIMGIAAYDTDRVSLRRLTPARFLMANFADSEATGCHS